MADTNGEKAVHLSGDQIPMGLTHVSTFLINPATFNGSGIFPAVNWVMEISHLQYHLFFGKQKHLDIDTLDDCHERKNIR